MEHTMILFSKYYYIMQWIHIQKNVLPPFLFLISFEQNEFPIAEQISNKKKIMKGVVWSKIYCINNE